MATEWTKRNRDYTITDGETGFSLNVAGMNFTDQDINDLSAKFAKAHIENKRIEAGDIKNPDENRQVTHFTDRMEYPKSADFAAVEKFAEDLRSGTIKSSTGKKFDALVVNGIGGSALGPQLVQFAIKSPLWNELSDEARNGYLKIYFTDNTDTAGVADIAKVVDLETTLVASISKSGGTQETKNNTVAFEALYKEAGLDFAAHAAAITMKGSLLDEYSRKNSWLAVFEMAESIGGRTSETSIVGHLPAALAGVDFKAMLEGACHMDVLTREESITKNPAYLLSAMWFIAGEGKGNKNMVIVPYSDRLVLMSRYLQQLVMESIGKEFDLDGNPVYQGLNVFGNKGGTDAHAFIQQLNDGRNDFFVTFIEIMKDPMNVKISDKSSMSDYLHGFQAGLSSALRGKERQVIEMSLREVDEFNVGMLIALYERAVATYAELVNVNAFHQPGVQSYKLASKTIIDMIDVLQDKLPTAKGFSGTAEELAVKIDMVEDEIAMEGIIAKFAENNEIRSFDSFSVSRNWNDSEWIYEVK